ncbi:MAG: hypothetical protein K6F05_07320 [Succinivibrio sp.]|nr:hypothetical protein [Succinivibrio sp.]
MKKLYLVSVSALLLGLTGCLSETEIKAANQVITALPHEVAGCTFIADVDSYGSAIMENARFYLKLAAAEKGATHVVEQFAYPTLIAARTIGVALSGRAYRCPEGLGPRLAAPKAFKQYEIPSADQLIGDGEGLASTPNIDWRKEAQRQAAAEN